MIQNPAIIEQPVRSIPRRRLVFALALTLGILMSLVAAVAPTGAAHIPAAAADVSLTHSRGALASCTATDPSGCVNTLAVAFGGLSSAQNPPGSGATTPVLLVFVYGYDVCAEATAFFGQVRGPAPDAEVTIDEQLEEGRLRATTTLVDLVSGAEVTVAVDLAWSGIGGIERGHARDSSRFDGCFLNVVSTSASRAATVSGSLVVGGMDLATGPAAAASLNAGRSSSVAVDCGGF